MISSSQPLDAQHRRPVVSFPLVVGLLVFFGYSFAAFPLSDGDTYWHIAVGKWIVEHRAIPTEDMFSYTMPGTAWTAHEWLSELVMFGLFDALSWPGLQVFAAAMYGATVAYMLRFLLDRMEPVHAIPVCGISIALMQSHFLARPHVLVWPLTALWVGTLVRVVETRTRPPWWLLGVLVVWANLHASFNLALGFAGILAAEAVASATSRDERMAMLRWWAPFLIACGVCVLLNPQGFGAITHAIHVMSMTTTLDMVQEWQSADFHDFKFFLLWLLLLLTLGLSGKLRLSPFRLLLVVGLAYIALKHQRYHALVGLVTPFFLAAPLAAGLRRADRGTSQVAGRLDQVFHLLSRPAARISSIAALVVCVAFGLASPRYLRSQPHTSITPAKALAAFESTGVNARVFNNYSHGGFLIFRGVPVFVDGRSDMYGDAFMEEFRDARTLRKPLALESILKKYDIGWTLLAPDSPAVELLNHLPEWNRLYSDSVAVVHVRRALIDSAAVSNVRRNDSTVAGAAAPR